MIPDYHPVRYFYLIVIYGNSNNDERAKARVKVGRKATDLHGRDAQARDLVS